MKINGLIRFSLAKKNARQRARRYYELHKGKVFRANYRQRQHERTRLADNYVKHVIIETTKKMSGMSLRYGEITPSMVKAKREQLTLERGVLRKVKGLCGIEIIRGYGRSMK